MSTPTEHESQPSSQEASSNQRAIRSKTDPAWGHCKQLVEDGGKTALLCLHCNKIIRGGGINRFKCHLAGEKGQVEASWVRLQNSNFYRVRGHLLNHWIGEINKLVDSYRNIWKNTGCILMEDGWTDRSRRSLINFRVYCPKGTIFLKYVDASDVSKTATMLHKLFKEVILYVGAENIVHFVTDNAANYVTVGRLLEVEFPKLFWSPCAAHYINLMFQDIGKLEEVSEAVTHASKITKYIYNHCYALHLMRQHTGRREILRPAPTHFATNFIALQSILGQKDALRGMVTSREWTTSAYAKDTKAKKFVDQVLDSSFWKQYYDIVRLTEPLVRVLRIVDSEDKPAMSFLYRAIYKAREEMVYRFRRNKKKVERYLEILDRRWDLQLRKNLHSTGYWLNPAIQFNNDEFDKFWNTISGLLDVIERYSHGDVDLQSKLTCEMRLFKNSEGDFGRQTAIHDRNTVMPGQMNLDDNEDANEDEKHMIIPLERQIKIQAT
ncbi:hypothetical protein QQ045_032046 [Rhodiola kirilowii]